MRGILNIVVVLTLGWATSAYGQARQVVVELYTSQGCSSCPPADELLRELSTRDDVIPLAFHVDYWDYIGWKDPFARPENTRRQKEHSHRLGLRHIYTPQMIIQGAANVVGSNKWEIDRAIKKTRHFATLPINLSHHKKGVLDIEIPGAASKEPATVYLITFDDKHTTTIKRGENGGRQLSYFNVVRDMQPIGTWTGETFKKSVNVHAMAAAGRDAGAVIVQSKRTGRIIGAGKIRLPRKGAS